MADGTKIEWTDATVNAVNGCSVVSPGCTHCYAMRLAGTRLQHHASRAGLTMETKAGPVWNGKVRLNEKALLAPLRWRRPRRIFWNAHGDLFHENVPDEWIDRCFAVMALTPQHQHQVLTKRAERMRDYFALREALGERSRELRIDIALNAIKATLPIGDDRTFEMGPFGGCLPGLPLPNVWLGVSVEDQARADERIPDLLATPAAVRFLSCEPLLRPLDLRRFMWPVCKSMPARFRSWAEAEAAGELTYKRQALVSASAVFLDWVIVGGESGAKARPMHPDWARSVRDQCAAAGVPFFFKQWGEWAPDTGPIGDMTKRGGDPVMEGLGPCAVHVDGAWREYADGYSVPIELCSGHGQHVYRWGKKRAGRLLDGVAHDGMPA